MDIHCPNCGEPFDTYHMLHDEPYNWGQSAMELAYVLDHQSVGGANDRIREAARAAGFEFATTSLLSFTRCSSCKDRPALAGAAERRGQVAALASVLDGDDDALAVLRADHGL